MFGCRGVVQTVQCTFSSALMRMQMNCVKLEEELWHIFEKQVSGRGNALVGAQQFTIVSNQWASLLIPPPPPPSPPSPSFPSPSRPRCGGLQSGVEPHQYRLSLAMCPRFPIYISSLPSLSGAVQPSTGCWNQQSQKWAIRDTPTHLRDR